MHELKISLVPLTPLMHGVYDTTRESLCVLGFPDPACCDTPQASKYVSWTLVTIYVGPFADLTFLLVVLRRLGACFRSDCLTVCVLSTSGSVSSLPQSSYLRIDSYEFHYLECEICLISPRLCEETFQMCHLHVSLGKEC